MAMGFIDHTRRKDIVKQNIISIMDTELKNKALGLWNHKLNAMPIRRAELILDNMDFFEKGIYRTKGKESINKVCKMMLDILTGNDETVEFKMEEFAFTSGDDPMLQFEHFILDAPECEIRRVTGMVADSDLSVASYYLGEKAKERLAFASV